MDSESIYHGNFEELITIDYTLIGSAFQSAFATKCTEEMIVFVSQNRLLSRKCINNTGTGNFIHVFGHIGHTKVTVLLMIMCGKISE